MSGKDELENKVKENCVLDNPDCTLDADVQVVGLSYVHVDELTPARATLTARAEQAQAERDQSKNHIRHMEANAVKCNGDSGIVI